MRLGKIQKALLKHLLDCDGEAYITVLTKTHGTAIEGYWLEDLTDSIDRLRSRRLVHTGPFGRVTIEEAKLQEITEAIAD